MIGIITIRPGSHMHQLLRLLSVSGVFPSKSLGILGDTRTIKAMVHKMEAVQNIRLSSDNTILTTKLFQLSGKSDKRTIRLVKNALTVFNDLHQDALGYYLTSFPDNKFTGDQFHIWRNHRVGETIAMCMMADIETTPYILPELQKESIRSVIPKTPSYYVARNFKKIYEAELNKTIFTRMTGLLFYPGGTYAVYNTRESVMKWSGLGEIKARQELSEIVRMNAGFTEVTSALLFGVNEDIALRTLIESDKSLKRHIRFDRIYQSIHFVPLNRDGIDLLKILTFPDWHEKLMNMLFTQEIRPKGYGSFEYDAYRENRYYYSHLDGDIARLIRLKEALQSQEQSLGVFEVLCFPWQFQFLKEYFDKSVTLRQIDMPKVLNALGIFK